MKFAYKVSNNGNNFIMISRLEDINFEKNKSKHHYYILKEKELAEYIKKYPGCCSLVCDKDCEKEARRLYEKYGLEHLLGED